MSVYIQMEIFNREIYSRLLLAMDYASHGHQSFLGNLLSYVERGFFKPGIVHFKSLTPSPDRLRQVELFKKKNLF